MPSVKLTEEHFEKTIEENAFVILDFWAEWCAPCESFAPIYEAASNANPDILFGKINIEEEQGIAGGFRIRSIPMLMVFRDQIIVFSQAGALSGKQLDEVIAGARALDMDRVRANVAAQEAQQQGTPG